MPIDLHMPPACTRVDHRLPVPVDRRDHAPHLRVGPGQVDHVVVVPPDVPDRTRPVATDGAPRATGPGVGPARLPARRDGQTPVGDDPARQLRFPHQDVGSGRLDGRLQRLRPRLSCWDLASRGTLRPTERRRRRRDPHMPHFIRADELARGAIRHAMFFALPAYAKARPGRLRPRFRRRAPRSPAPAGDRLRLPRTAVEWFAPAHPNGWSPKGSTGTA